MDSELKEKFIAQSQIMNESNFLLLSTNKAFINEFLSNQGKSPQKVWTAQSDGTIYPGDTNHD